jgi:mannose-6-phosphate isomerase-like protein (cupin superfamily)
MPADLPQHRSREHATLITLPSLRIDIRVGVSTDTADGLQSVSEFTVHRGYQGPPPHWHRSFAETFIGVMGEFDVLCNGQRIHVMPGGMVFVPPRTVHTYQVTAGTFARFLLVCTPGAQLDRYFAEAAELVQDRGGVIDRDALFRLQEQYDTFAEHVPRE